MYPESKPKSYETVLLSKCATCSLNFTEESPKATKLRILRNEENSVDYQEITNTEVLSFIFGMPAYKFSSNVISNLEDSFRPEDYEELKAGQPFKTLSDIPSWFCLALCQSCAPRLAELYSTHKEFANNLALDSIVYKATNDKPTNFNNHVHSYPDNSNTRKAENNSCEVKLENQSHKSDDDIYHSDVESPPASPQSSLNLQTDDEDNTNLAEENLPISDVKQNDKTVKTSFPSRWLCKDCDIQFVSEYAISVHKIEFHDGLRLDISRVQVKGPPFCCPISPCDKKFAKQHGVKYHCLRKHRVKLLASNDNEKPSFCNICRLSFTTIQGLRLHWAKVHADRTEKELDLSLSVNPPEKKKCHRCQIEFKSIKEMQQHGLISHLPKLLLDRLKDATGTKVRCLHCQSTFEGIGDFNIHCENQDQCTIRQNEDVSQHCDETTESANAISANIVSTGETISDVEERKNNSAKDFNCDDISQGTSKDDQLEVHTEAVKGPPYQCPKCSTSYKKLEGLKDHCRRVHQLKLPSQRKFEHLNVPCRICSTIFSNVTGLKNHSRLTHSLSYFCGTCYKAFENECLLNTHIDNDNCKFEKLDTCNTNFKVSNTIRKENEASVSKSNATLNDKPFLCTFCDQGFEDGPEFENHVAEIHNQFKCCHCFRNFSSIQVLEMHSKRHSVDFPDIRCEFCEKDFASIHHMLIHQKHIHFEELMLPEIKEECHLCDKWYKWKSHLTMHILKHHTSLEKPHKCETCGKSFAVSKLLSLHVKKYHEREKTFKCPHCDKSFLYIRPFNIHVLGHSEERPVPCDKCEKRFKSEDALKRHSLIHEPREKQFFCEKCGSGFKRKDHFAIHMTKHEDQEKLDESYDCKICGAKMKHSHSLKTHMQWKHPADNKGKFFCKFCEKKFRDSYRLSRHIKSRHSDEKCPKLNKVPNEKMKSSFQPPLVQERVNMEASSSSVLDLRPPTAEIRQPLDYAAPISQSEPLPAHHDSNVQYPHPMLPFVNYNQVDNYSTPYFHL